ncbi:sugar kinase [Micromonospora mirobrigensis]|uniref:2-dehydro-3-deoxygluconokinase n=1 Tax=Micromonospora mirobrigensis TaxID=262898 RepID=A0A1C5AL41_9ACTN|nr:sugar kinase [Micromonospora mirobrigensis]SCF45714.1 2-dehydro-3-deoxygluconokinase [Micromonospora mirobrigensis]
MLDVVTFGEVMGLLVAYPGQPLRHANDFRRQIAGAEATVAVGLARLGHRTGWCGRVGEDAFGLAVMDTLRGEGVDVSRAGVDPGAPTGLLVRDAHPHRRITVSYHRAGSAASRTGPQHLDPGYLRSARLLHLTGITPALSESCLEAVREALRIARDGGLTVSFDPNIRLRLWPAQRAVPILRELLAGVDIVLASREEARLIAGREDAAAWFLEHGSRLVVIKDGAVGAHATDGRTEWAVPAFDASVLDPVGAGDAFDAGFLSGWLSDLPVPQCLARGAAAGALNVQALGDLDGLPYPDDLQAMLNKEIEVDR